jgi:aldehyde:ferredoxin oxidoreductase
MKYGYNGKIAIIDLNSKEVIIEDISEKLMRKYMGGKGLISYFLNKEEYNSYEPSDPIKNNLYYMTGVMSGIPAAGTSRIVIGGKSPLTGGFGNAESGGFFATELKKAGYDGLIIKNKSEKPVYIYIEDGKIEIQEAQDIWGLETGKAYNRIKEKTNNKNVKISLIGPAGEKGVLYSCIVNDLKHVCGRNGLGSLMGSKNLKAIAVFGSKQIEFFDKDKIKEVSKWYAKQYRDNPLSLGLYKHGTAGGVTSFNKSGILPTRNFKEGYFEKASEISGEKMTDTILKKREGCFACPVRCKRVVELENDKFKVDPSFGGPEYETIGAFGSLCGNGNLEIVAKAHEMCNRYGLDTISTGVSIAFAMECYEKGLIDKSNTDGIELKFGNEEAILQMIDKINLKQGIGSILAMGTKRASEIIGGNSIDYAMQVKGQELPMHEPRGKTGVGMGYVLSPTGADHMQAAHDTMFTSKGPVLDGLKQFSIFDEVNPFSLDNSKVRMYMYLEMWWSFLNMAGVCDFIPQPRGSMPVEKLLDLVNAATGWNVSLWEALKAGERGIVSARIYNYKCGLDYKTEKLPERFHEPLANGALKGKKIDKNEFEKSISTYFKLMGWNEVGLPNQEKIDELGVMSQ